MGLKSQVDQMAQRSARTLRRIGVVGELVDTATVNLFVVTGGPVLARIVGIITANMAIAATTVQLRNNAIVMSLASGSLSGQVAGIHLNPTGAVGVAIAVSAGVGVGVYQPTNAFSLSPGTVNILIGGATNLTGAIDWYLTYESLLPQATVQVA